MKYYNDAIIGNENMVATFSQTGELLRICYPNADYRQFLDFFHVGLKVNDSNILYLHDDINNKYKQYYTENTNILNTEIVNSYFKLKIIQTDFISIKNNILIKKYKFKNENTIDLNVKLIAYSQLISDKNNQVSGYYKNGALMQYMHDYTFCTFSKTEADSYQINNTKENIELGEIGGKDYIGMSPDSSIAFKIGTLKPGEEATLDMFIYIKENSAKLSMEKLETEMKEISKKDVKKEYDETRKYWTKYLKEHDSLELGESTNVYKEKIKEIYNRTILLFPLLTNHKTGGISAGIEIDEDRTKCGRYSYCWPRDAIFITTAMDILKMQEDTEKFYLNFCKNTQSKNGMWEQRFYTDGNLAPCWGYQIDETASVIYGVYNHYKFTKDIEFLKSNLKMCEKATDFLLKYINDLFEETGKYKLSYDLWEENEGVHTYSLASIFSAFECIINIYDILMAEFKNNRLKQEKMRKQTLVLQNKLLEIREYIIKNLYDLEKKSFVRSYDKKMDISILGLVTPFKLFTPKDKKMLNTVERINMSIRTYTGGYLRYEGDTYAGGNPWVIANLWLASYYIDAGEKAKAKECFKFVVDSATNHGFLGEQIDNRTMKPAWVIGLGWSHALFIIVLNKLKNEL